MARQKSEDKRIALMQAATRVIVSQGLSAPTATIAQAAGVSNGSLFTYFETKTELYNQLYLGIKTGMATASLDGFPAKAGLREQLFHVWTNWTRWALDNPEKRRALALLSVSEEITAESHLTAGQSMAFIAQLIEKSRANGPLKDAPMSFILKIMNSLAEATMDFMISDAENAEKHSRAGFEALWRVLD